jgi:hypothetical protein
MMKTICDRVIEMVQKDYPDENAADEINCMSNTMLLLLISYAMTDLLKEMGVIDEPASEKN